MLNEEAKKELEAFLVAERKLNRRKWFGAAGALVVANAAVVWGIWQQGLELARTTAAKASVEALDKELAVAKEQVKANLGVLRLDTDEARKELRTLRDQAAGRISAQREIAEEQTSKLEELRNQTTTASAQISRTRESVENLEKAATGLTGPEASDRIRALRALAESLQPSIGLLSSLQAGVETLRASQDVLSKQLATFEAQRLAAASDVGKLREALDSLNRRFAPIGASFTLVGETLSLGKVRCDRLIVGSETGASIDLWVGAESGYLQIKDRTARQIGYFGNSKDTINGFLRVGPIAGGCVDIAASEAGGATTARNGDGKIVTEIGTSSTTRDGVVSIRSADGRPRIGLFTTTGRGQLQVVGESGQYLAFLGVAPDEMAASLSLWKSGMNTAGVTLGINPNDCGSLDLVNVVQQEVRVRLGSSRAGSAGNVLFQERVGQNVVQTAFPPAR